MPNTVEATRKDVDQETVDELVSGQPHDLLPVTALDTVVFLLEGNIPGVGADQAAVRDRHPMGVAAEVGQHLVGSPEGRFGIDHPFGFAERGLDR